MVIAIAAQLAVMANQSVIEFRHSLALSTVSNLANDSSPLSNLPLSSSAIYSFMKL
jgi:hypothetical protein